jgi:Arc/MetJ-type ribon-helix-helix transcriptional regulator
MRFSRTRLTDIVHRLAPAGHGFGEAQLRDPGSIPRYGLSMATKKITISLPEAVIGAVDALAPDGNRSAFIEAAVADRLERAERARRAVKWLANRARTEDPDGFEQAMEAVMAADRRRGYDTAQAAAGGQAA